MSDFNNLCDTFDVMGLKYVINETSTERQLVIEDSNRVEQIGMTPDCVLWFEFDTSGNFEKLYVEE